MRPGPRFVLKKLIRPLNDEPRVPDFMDHLTIETPEQIPLEFALAGIGSRFLALALDTLIQAAAAALLLVLAIAVAPAALAWPQAGVWAAAILVFLLFLIQFGYFAFFEALWSGQTPGKRALHLRVIKATGRRLGTLDAIARNLLRIVDALPGVYAVGVLSALISPESRRLGDYVAGTVVVREGTGEEKDSVAWAPTLSTAGTRYDVNRVAGEEFAVIEAFLVRRDQLDHGVRTAIASKILDRLAPKLGLSAADRARPEAVLESLAAQYRRQARSG
jgi:uncharacterized RDD family membrane protein YckC